MSSPRRRIARAPDGTPLRYVVGNPSDARQSVPVDPKVVGDAYARLPGAKGRIYLGPVRSGVTSTGTLMLAFNLSRMPVLWDRSARGIAVELELEPTEALDGELEEQPTKRMRSGGL